MKTGLPFEIWVNFSCPHFNGGFKSTNYGWQIFRLKSKMVFIIPSRDAMHVCGGVGDAMHRASTGGRIVNIFANSDYCMKMIGHNHKFPHI